MCGIVGIYTRNKATETHLKWFKTLLLVDQLRGEHATGIAKIDTHTGAINVHKKAMSAVEYLSNKENVEFIDKYVDRGNLYIGHNRYATMGNKADDKNAHPFTYKHITMVHNGTVDRWVMKDLEGFVDLDVDSEMVCRTIANLGIEEAVKKFSGAFSLVWWDDAEKSLNFLRNDKRPMSICHYDGTMMWASEEAFLGLILSREKNITEANYPYSTAPNQHYRWLFDEKGALKNNGRCSIRRMEIPEIDCPVFGYHGNWGRRNNNVDTSYRGSDDGKYADDGTYIGTPGSIERGNKVFKEKGLPFGMGDRTRFQVTHVERTHRYDSNLTVYGEVDTDKELVEFKAFNVPLVDFIKGYPVSSHVDMRGLLPMGKMKVEEFREEVQALDKSYEVTNEVCGTISGHYIHTENKVTTFRISLAKIKSMAYGDSSRPFVQTPKEEKAGGGNEEGTEKGKFPMKVLGMTFDTLQEFLNVTSIGCSCCGDIPTRFSKNNQYMTVYSTCGANRPSPKDAEFICGDCIVGDEEAKEKANSETKEARLLSENMPF